jgi:phospholipid/cholesterol/gamma-HCH transport system substrate-binding protein
VASWSARSHGDRATLDLALDPGKVDLVPANVQAQLLPKTLFGEKEVALIVPSDASSRHIAQGDTIPQDRSSTALETETALNDLLPLLRSLKPQALSMTLNALSTALRGRGSELGANLALNAAYFRRLNPSLPTLAHDMQGLADLTDSYSAATPDLLRTLDNLSYSGRSLVQERTALDAFLRTTEDFAASARSLVGDNAQRFEDLARDSIPSLQLYAKYSPGYACLLNRVAFQEIEGERDFGGAQPGLHITVEVVSRSDPYVHGDEPQYKESRSGLCFGLGPKPIIPFPVYENPQDGYHDSDPPEQPGTGPKGSQASWLGPVAQPPVEVVHQTALPRTLTALDALLVAPLLGSGT